MNDSARDKESHKVFVYGTLKGMDRPGRGRDKAGVKFLGKGHTYFGTFCLHGGGFPVANRINGIPKGLEAPMGHILGELYEVSTKVLQGLDDYEGAPHFYEAEPVTLVMEDGRDELALMYFGRDVNISLAGRPIIEPDNNNMLYWPFPSEYR